jgi:hypothetical protein
VRGTLLGYARERHNINFANLRGFGYNFLMSLDLRNIARLGLVLGVLGAASCSNYAQQTVSDSTAYLAETAVGSINSALTDDERSDSVVGAGNAASRKMGISRNLAGTGCGNARYTPALGTASCSGTTGGVTVTSVLNCSVAQGLDALLKGTVTLTFDNASDCAQWLSGTPAGSVTWTSDKLLRTTSDSSGVITSSDPVKNYKGVTIGGGMKSAFGTGTSVNINGLHVTRLATGNVPVFDHTITTTGALGVSGTLAAGTRTITTGIVVVDHNTQLYTATGTIANLKWTSPNCCLPATGTINFALSGSASGNVLVDFNTGTCGKVAVTDSSVIATQANPSPTPIPSGMASNYTTTIGGCQ